MIDQDIPEVSYMDVAKRISWRHSRTSINESLQQAIEWEAHHLTEVLHPEWLVAMEEYNQQYPPGTEDAPPPPEEPTLDVDARRACYEQVENRPPLTSHQRYTSEVIEVVYDDVEFKWWHVYGVETLPEKELNAIRKMEGIEFAGVMCSATAEDQWGLSSIETDIHDGAEYKYHFANGNVLTLNSTNWFAFIAVWKPFRASFFQ